MWTKSACSLVLLVACATTPDVNEHPEARCERLCEEAFARCMHDHPRPDWCERDLGECVDMCL